MNLDTLIRRRLTPDFFQRPTITVAQAILGKYLVVNRPNLPLQVGRITETEAYLGLRDKASHASRGRTPRTATMFGPPGHLYVYLIYGIYHLVNISTGPKDYPAAVLLRSLTLLDPNGSPAKEQTAAGPGKLTRALGITTADLGRHILTDQEIFLSHPPPDTDKPVAIVRTPRIGIDYAPQPWISKTWRFLTDLR